MGYFKQWHEAQLTYVEVPLRYWEGISNCEPVSVHFEIRRTTRVPINVKLYYLQKLTKTGIITISGPSRGQICPIRKVQHPIETMPKTALHPCYLPASHPEPHLVKSKLGLDQSWATCLRRGRRVGTVTWRTKTRSTSTSTATYALPLGMSEQSAPAELTTQAADA